MPRRSAHHPDGCSSVPSTPPAAGRERQERNARVAYGHRVGGVLDRCCTVAHVECGRSAPPSGLQLGKRVEAGHQCAGRAAQYRTKRPIQVGLIAEPEVQRDVGEGSLTQRDAVRGARDPTHQPIALHRALEETAERARERGSVRADRVRDGGDAGLRSGRQQLRRAKGRTPSTLIPLRVASEIGEPASQHLSSLGRVGALRQLIMKLPHPTNLGPGHRASPRLREIVKRVVAKTDSEASRALRTDRKVSAPGWLPMHEPAGHQHQPLLASHKAPAPQDEVQAGTVVPPVRGVRPSPRRTRRFIRRGARTPKRPAVVEHLATPSSGSRGG